MSGPPFPEPEEPTLRDRLEVLRRHWALVVGSALVAVAAAVALTASTTARYEASAEVLLQQEAAEDVLDGGRQQNAASLQQRVQTEIEVMRSRSVVQAVTAELGRTPEVTVAPKGETQVVEVRARADDPTEAAAEADTYASVYVNIAREQSRQSLTDAAAAIRDQLTRLDDRVASLRTEHDQLSLTVAATTDPAERAELEDQQRELAATIEAQELSLASRRVALTEQVDQLELTANLATSRGVRVVSEAEAPTDPVSPRPERDVPLALVLGLVVGVALAFLRDHLDDRIRSKEDLDRVTGGLNVLGLIPEVRGWRDRSRAVLEVAEHPASSASEAYRGLRTSLQFLGLDRKVHLIQVTSSDVGEGKSTTAANLAITLARAGKRVVLVDGDLRRPRAHQFFGVDNEVGFTSAVIGEHSALQAVAAVPGAARLAVLPSGPVPPNPSELLATKAATKVLDDLKEFTDYVVVDSPPLLPVSDSVILAGYVDAVVVVATARATTGEALRRSLELLHQIEAPVVGVVLNRAGDRGSYHPGYGYAAAAEAEPRRRRTRRRRPRSGPADASAEVAAAG